MTESTPTASADKRERSPSFPFIPLDAVVARLEEYEKVFARQEPPADKTFLAWGMKGDTSQAQQTLAALKAFGFVEYKGSGPKRPVALTSDGRTYLRAQQDSVKLEVLKRAALKPKWIGYFWGVWGTKVVPDPIRLDQLVLKHKFIESGAPKFLKVYDATIRFAGLTDSDKADEVTLEDEEDSGLAEDPPPGDQNRPKRKGQQVTVMDGERVAFIEEGEPGQYLKLIASGSVDDTMLEALEDFVKRQRKRLGQATAALNEHLKTQQVGSTAPKADEDDLM